jgi:hypothetical protein
VAQKGQWPVNAGRCQGAFGPGGRAVQAGCLVFADPAGCDIGKRGVGAERRLQIFQESAIFSKRALTRLAGQVLVLRSPAFGWAVLMLCAQHGAVLEQGQGIVGREVDSGQRGESYGATCYVAGTSRRGSGSAISADSSR